MGRKPRRVFRIPWGRKRDQISPKDSCQAKQIRQYKPGESTVFICGRPQYRGERETNYHHVGGRPHCFQKERLLLGRAGECFSPRGSLRLSSCYSLPVLRSSAYDLINFPSQARGAKWAASAVFASRTESAGRRTEASSRRSHLVEQASPGKSRAPPRDVGEDAHTSRFPGPQKITQGRHSD